MKLLFLLFIIAIVGFGVYFFVNRKNRSKKINKKAVKVTTLVVILLLGLLTYGMYRSATAPDMQCEKTHVATTKPPMSLNSAKDYFDQANYDYDTGDCNKAITHYTNAIKLDPN